MHGGMCLLLLLLLVPTALNAIASLAEAPSDELTGDRTWTMKAMEKLWQERREMRHTPIFKWTYPAQNDVEFIFKNESASRTGSLKHRYALMLMMWALREGHIDKNTVVYEASSGNTANSLAYMCRLIGVNFTAIVPDTIEVIKQEHIEENGGHVIKVPIAKRIERAREEANKNGGFFMNQFGNADRAEDFHESGNFSMESANVFHELLIQLQNDKNLRKKIPDYFIHSAGTGGTISSVGRYIRKYSIPTQVVLEDTQFSVYYDYVLHNMFTNESGASLWVTPGMAGTGFGLMGMAKYGETTSLDAAVIDRVVKVPDIASTAAMAVLREQGISGGTSSGINFLTGLHIAASKKPVPGNTVMISTLLADVGRNYEGSYYNRTWIQENFKRHGGLETYDCWVKVIRQSLADPFDPLDRGTKVCKSGEF